MPIFKWLQRLRCRLLNRALCVRLAHLLHYNGFHPVRTKWANKGWRVKSLLANGSLGQIKLFADFPRPQLWNFKARISDWAQVCLYMQHVLHMSLSYSQRCLHKWTPRRKDDKRISQWIYSRRALLSLTEHAWSWSRLSINLILRRRLRCHQSIWDL